jgi:hypothetical protein
VRGVGIETAATIGAEHLDVDLRGDRTDCEWCSAHVASDISISIERGPDGSADVVAFYL